ncbi:MAG TPA: universal stress protein [Bacteroidia bacterium]|nr:universal stress protein [Bacteroidia bacterium]
MKILVATDYSAVATNAVKYALQFSADTNAEIIFLHVFKTSSRYPEEFSSLERFDDSPVEFETRELEQYIDGIVNSFNIEKTKLQYKCYVRQGNASEDICDEAIYSNADIIITGTHGTSQLAQVLLGSHTWDVIKKASIPVLAIPPEAQYTGVHNFVLATEYRTGELPVIKFLTQWIKPFNGELVLFHVSNDVFSKDFEKELHDKFQAEVKNTIPNENIDIKMIMNNNLIEGLNDFCINTGSSWLVMSPEKSLLFEKIFNPLISTTKKMSFYTHVPLLTIPDYTSATNLKFWNKIKEEYAI